ncbi:MAG: energy-coupled thiamine transporter ThiT [Clostridiaceae bacterium]|nr:energy-coupled thiamine transporter ThiT [Clostridiaceae bacterium]
MTKQKKKIRMLAEGALVVAMSIVLSYIEIPIGLQYGGTIDFVMIPIIIYSVRWGAGCGLLSGLVFGTLKFFLAGGFAINWQSMLLDYSLAYMMVGLAGLIKNNPKRIWQSVLIGSAARFLIHYISGVTIYAEYMPDVFMGLKMTSPYFYSLLYNISYMLPSTIAALVCCSLLARNICKYIVAEDLK